MSHPDPHGEPDLTPVRLGEVWENPATGERATVRELPFMNSDRRATAELVALFGARLPGEHRHPALVERLTVVGGELTVKIDGQTSVLRQAESVVIEPNVWHDFWNASDYPARVLVQITPGERFAHMIETMFGLARLGHTNEKGVPHPLQLALTAQEFSDVVVFRRPPVAIQRLVFGVLAPIARRRGYRATYPQLSRTVLAPRPHGAVPAPGWPETRRCGPSSSRWHGPTKDRTFEIARCSLRSARRLECSPSTHSDLGIGGHSSTLSPFAQHRP